ncbi:MAG TPA: tetratricopeptide repeat protein, partial [Pyrinomonadaceae bacterium]|nr:tetratricopeptide repeat protein [Pyrinomonadaceae bacterium]
MKTLHTQTTAFAKRLFKLERCGKYEEALAELTEIWEDTTTFPNVEEFESRSAAEIILRCGSLIGFLGHSKQIPNAQEKSKNLLTEARHRFLDIYDIEKIAECENYLALAYWRTGELTEAETWIEESFSHTLPLSNQTRLYSTIVKCLVHISAKKYEEIISILRKLENEFLSFGDNCLVGDFYNNYAIALKNLGETSDALNKLELARYYHQKSRHLIYLGTVENNLAQLYKAERKFIKAHEASDNAAKIFKQIKDRTREGFSLDTKAQIYFAEGKYAEALKTIETAVKILSRGENAAYLTETYLTKAKTLIFLDDFSAATFSLFDGVQIAKTQISEEAAKKLVEEFEKTLQEKNSPRPAETITDFETISENLELVIPPTIAHYNEFQAIWIKNTHLESLGLKKGSLAIIAKEKVRRGDLAAIVEIETEGVSCGFYDADFG